MTVNQARELRTRGLLPLNIEREIEVYRTEDSFGPVVVQEYGDLRVLSPAGVGRW